VPPRVYAPPCACARACNARFAARRSPDWLANLRRRLEAVPGAGLGECGLDKGARMAMAPIGVQEAVFRQQLLLGRELARPVSVRWGF
jgi:Tat protein secretion system quality control protein TatD with DNase activity